MDDKRVRMFRGDVTVGGVLTQTQRVHFEPSPRRLRVTESGEFAHRPDATATCEFVIRPTGYEAIVVRLIAKGVRRDMEIAVDGAAASADVVFGGGGTRVAIQRHGEFALFDGPNAMFDYVNCTMLLGLAAGETQACVVNVIDWGKGLLIPEQYTYVRSDREILVHKEHAPGQAAVLELDDDGCSLVRVRVGPEETLWSEVAA